jgi:nucleoside-diphosphate-sugar epimerase
LTHCSNYSIAKAQKLLDYQPRYSSMEGVWESLTWLIEHGQLMGERRA